MTGAREWRQEARQGTRDADNRSSGVSKTTTAAPAAASARNQSMIARWASSATESNKHQHDMLLAGPDTKSPRKHEEISEANNDNTPNELSSPACGSSLADELTTPADSMDSPLASAAGDDRLADSHNLADSHDLAIESMAESPDQAASGLIGAEAEEAKQVTQLSVPAEENFAFKSYINAQVKEKEDQEEGDVEEFCLDTQQVIGANVVRDTGPASNSLELRLLVRRREAGALIGKKGANIKRLRESFRSSMFSIPDTGNGPERVVCITSEASSLDAILADITQLLLEKSPEKDEQVELKLLIHSSHAGSIIGIGGQSIKRLRNESKAAIKIYEMCCPLSNERICAIKAKPPVVVSTIKLIQSILEENPVKGTIKPYDALHFDLSLVDKYGGYLPEEPAEMFAHSAHTYAASFVHESACHHNQTQLESHYNSPSGWRSKANSYCDPCDLHAQDQTAAFQRMSSSSSSSSSLMQNQPGNLKQREQHKLDPSKSDHLNETTKSKFVHHRSHLQPINRSASRFHPYVGIPSVGGASCHASHPSHRSNGRHQSTSALHYPSSYSSAAILAAAAAAASGQPAASPRAPYAQLAGHPMHHFGPPAPASRPEARAVAHQFLCPNNSGTCRHMRPCLCMFLPMMHHETGRHHQSAMLAAYGQVSPLDAGEEFNPFHQTTDQQRPPRQQLQQQQQQHQHQQQQHQQQQQQETGSSGSADSGRTR